jgi:hypothetical protein
MLGMGRKADESGRGDCLPCKLVGGGGLMGAGLYVASQVKRQGKTPLSFALMSAFAGGINMFNYANFSI